MDENEIPEVTCTGSIKLNFSTALKPPVEDEDDK